MLARSKTIRAQLPRESAPLEIVPGLGIVSVVFFRYDVYDIDFYTEAAVGIAVRPARHGGPGVADLISGLGDDHVHAYVLSLPVNSEIAQVRGHDGYGFPKWVTDLDVEIGAQRTTARVANDDGGVDVEFSAPTPQQKTCASGEKVSTLTSYTQRDGAWHATLNQTKDTDAPPFPFQLPPEQGRTAVDEMQSGDVEKPAVHDLMMLNALRSMRGADLAITIAQDTLRKALHPDSR